MTKTELVSKAQKGDNTAIEQIYLLTHNSVCNKIYSAINNADDAEDILQDCYLTLIEKIGELKDPKSFEKWFNTIVSNKIKDYQKKKAPVLLDESEYNALSNSPEENSAFIPHENIERSDNIETIRKLISELSDKNRQSIEMHYLKDKGISEIADELGVPENTVKTRLHNGRNKIKKNAGIKSKKLLITILILILLAIITIFAVSSSEEFFSKITYNFHNTYGEVNVNPFYKTDYPQAIEEVYTLSYVPEGFELYDLYEEEESQIYYEAYKLNDRSFKFNQFTFNMIGTFDTENAEITTEVINGFEVMCLKSPLYSKYSWNDENYMFSLNIYDNSFSHEEAVKMIEGITPKYDSPAP